MRGESWRSSFDINKNGVVLAVIHAYQMYNIIFHVTKMSLSGHLVTKPLPAVVVCAILVY